MKRNVFHIITCLLLMLSTIGLTQNTINKDEAYKIIKMKGLVDTLNNEVRVSKSIIPSNTEILLWFTSIKSPKMNTWCFLIDLYPFYSWTHPCKYVFVSVVDGSYQITDAQETPNIDLEYLLRQEPKEHLPPADFSEKKCNSK